MDTIEILTPEMIEERSFPCAEGIRKFREAYPNGVEVTAENVRKAVDSDLDVDWLLGGDWAPRIFPFNPARIKENAALIARELRKAIRSGEVL